MDVHRCRFVPYPPSAINALAFSHPSPASDLTETPASLRLAVGRANGDIEIWNPLQGVWFHESTLQGGLGRSIEGLAWIRDANEDDGEGHQATGCLRLFSIGYSNAVTEWDLSTGKSLRHSGGNHGEVWCLAAQPWRPGPIEGTTKAIDLQPGQDLAIGCADGEVALLSTEDGDLNFKRFLAPSSAKRARVLTVTFRDRSVVLAGCADGTIRVLDSRNGLLIRNLSLGAGPIDGPRDTLVWTVKAFPNGDFVSGDSTGEVRFWDGQTYSLLQRLKGHVADILDLEVSADGRTVVSGGMDQRTTIYRRALEGHGSQRSRWATIAHQRLHSHDVKSMVAYDSRLLSVVVSGGLDTNLIITPLREFGNENHRTISSLPQTPPLHSAPGQNLLISWWDQQLQLWRFNVGLAGAAENEQGVENSETGRFPTLFARIGIKDDENIASAALSSCGTLLVVSTVSKVKLFQLQVSNGRWTTDTQKIRKIQIPRKMFSCAARLVLFSPDSRWICIVAPNSQVFLARVVAPSSSRREIKVSQTFVRLKRLRRGRSSEAGTTQDGSLGAYPSTINRAAFSSDSRMLVVADLSGQLDSWVCVGRVNLSKNAVRDHYQHTPSSSTPDEEEDSDVSEARDEKSGKSTLVSGQRWILNPSVALLPRLPTAALLLTFRPTSAPDSSSPDSCESLDRATGDNPHPSPPDIFVHDDRLVILTAQHQIYEFEMLEGRLSAWSRRNPSSCLPLEFKSWRDRAKGCVWDVRQNQNRLWLYGSAWLCMFDLSQDFCSDGPAISTEEPKTKQRRKRKRDLEDATDFFRPSVSGAGSKIPESRLSVSLGRKMRRIDGEDVGHATATNLDRSSDRHLETEEASAEAWELARTRRGLVETLGGLEEDGTDMHGEKAVALADAVTVGAPKLGTAFWSTLRYRSVLGIAHIGGDAGHASSTAIVSPEGDHLLPLQVAIVERPLWDVELPPLFNGDRRRG